MPRRRTGKGYVVHKHSTEHQEVVKAYGIIVPTGFDIHHEDRNKRNNLISNLQVISHTDHMRLHAGVRPDEPKSHEYVPVDCPECGYLHLVQYRCTKRANFTGMCKECNGSKNGVNRKEA